MNLEGIKNIIFDLGGVIINIDYNLTIRAFENLGIKHADIIYSQKKQTEIFDLLETGKISPGEFCEGIRHISGISASDNDIIEAWNAMLLDFPDRIFDLLHAAHKKYKTFLLSNTNEIHYSAYSKILERQLGEPSLSNFFDKQYLSHEIGMRKPDTEVFRLVIEENGLLPDETLFIDDSPQHIEGARKAGLKTHWLKDNDLHKFMKSYNLI
jgi:putative hydrolase of the HAD superfamily